MSIQPVIKQPTFQRYGSYTGEENSPFRHVSKELVKQMFTNIIATELMANFQDWKSTALVCRRWADLMKEVQQEAFQSIADKLMKEAKEKWESHFGKIDQVPALPNNIVQILRSPCPFWPNKKVRETHMLVLIPKTVNGKPLTLEYMSELVQNPKQGNKTQFRDSYFNNHEKTPVDQSHWVLITKDVIPDSRNKTYTDQLQLVQSYNQKSGITHEVPKLIDATVCIFLEYVQSDTRLYSDNPWTYTRCQENGKYEKMLVGGFSVPGLRVSSHDDFDDPYSNCGLSVFRKFQVLEFLDRVFP